MKQTRRTSIIILILLIVACGPMIWAQLNYFWEREYEPVSFHFHYEHFEGFACNTWEGYQTQTESLTFLNGMTMITMTENTVLDPLLMDVTFTSTASGTGLTASGQYVRLFRSGLDNIIEDVGDPFIIPTDENTFILDLSAMKWADCYDSGIIGHALKISFTLDKSGISETHSADFTYTVSVGIGTE